jgi:glycosyltransferase involved in cell wall biosynthesis
LDAVRVLGPEQRPVVRLHGPDWRGGRARVAAMVRARGLDPWVSVGPSVHGSAKRGLVSSARAFVYPSRGEAFGNSVAVAAALGVPVLTTSYPLGTYLHERSAGVAAAADAHALAAGLERVLSPEAAELGRRARHLVSEELSWEVVARSWMEQVEALL